MSDPKETVYHADPHTRAKHRILEAYLARWLPIVDSQAKQINRTDHRLLYVDGFAGAGVYLDDVPGSPLIPILTAVGHSHDFACPIEIRLIEKRRDRVDNLKRVISEKKAALLNGRRLIIPDPIAGDCEEEIRRLIAEHEAQRHQLGPAFFFLDQFGYSSVSMDLIRTILSNPVCEVFSYLNWNLFCPFMADETKHPGITRAFGGDEWREALALSGLCREQCIRETYLDALRSRGGARYALPFSMRGPDHRVIYWLFFCSNSLDGLEQMKRAMWSVDRSGGYEFSDKFVADTSSLFEFTEDRLIEALATELVDRTMTVEQLREHVLLSTPACNYFNAFKRLERDGRLRVVGAPQGRQACSFSKYPQMSIRIERAQTSLFEGGWHE